MKGAAAIATDESYSPLKRIILLAWPVVIEQILLTLVQYVDTAMVGSLGAIATAAIAINGPCIWIVNGIMSAASIGLSVQSSRALGAGDLDRVKLVSRQSLLVILSFGLLASVLYQILGPVLPAWLGAEPEVAPLASAYLRIVTLNYVFNFSVTVFGAILRGIGDTRTPMMLSLLSNILNVCGNFLLIYPTREINLFGLSFTMPGAGWGVQGAAAATTFSVAVSGILMAVIIFTRNTPARISLHDSFRPDGAILKEAFRIGYPMALERISINTGQILMTTVVASLGTVNLAAHHLAINAESLCYMPAYGFGAAATTLVAQSMGARRPDLAMRFGKMTNWMGFGVISLMGVLLFLLAEPLMGIFTPDTAVIAVGADLLRIIAFAQPLSASASIMASALRGARDTRAPFFIALFSMWGVRILLMFILLYGFDLGIYAVWLAMFADLAIRGILCWIRFYRGRWQTVDQNF